MQIGAVHECGGKREKDREGGRRCRQREGGIKDVKEGMVRGRVEGAGRIGEKDRGREGRKLKVSVRTECESSELDRETAAVTSVLISPSAG